MSKNVLPDSNPKTWLIELPALGMDTVSIATDFRRYFSHTLGRDKYCQSTRYPYAALALSLRDRLIERWRKTHYAYEQQHCKRVYYLSLEFLMGRALSNGILNLGIDDEVNRAVRYLGLALEEIAESEHDAGLGNGGLGRLAACFLDSCATLQLPVMGYGIRYEYGMFRQDIINGQQIEEPDHWLRDGNPWELERPEYTRRIHFCGHGEFYNNPKGELRVRWVETQDVLAVPYDVPIPGYQNGTVNTLRLWKAVATDAFNLGEFNAGSYPESVAAKNAAEHITMVLYPNDASENGKVLRLRQQYFLASASLQDVLDGWVGEHGTDFSQFPEKNCFQLNDTHPACAVPELMRLLMDVYDLGWEAAWAITSRTLAYTNHTLLPEALERWPVRLFGELLPRLLDIIYEINARFLAEVAHRWPGDNDRLRRMSIIEEGSDPQIRMAYLAIVGSFSVNGVAVLHSNLLQRGLFRDFYKLWPHKFNNKTNGVTQRRWLKSCNPDLSQLINETIGDDWITDLPQLKRLLPSINEAEFCRRWQAIKQKNKIRLAQFVQSKCGISINTEALFDVQVKRIHEYKRQLLNILHVIHLYDRLKRGAIETWTPPLRIDRWKSGARLCYGKNYHQLICNVAQTINSDTEVGDQLQVIFLPNYGVSAMEVICPGTDLSEQNLNGG